jgi:hypothetical protein
VGATRTRAQQFDVAERVTFLEGDGAHHQDRAGFYDIGMAIGATWIGGGLVGTIDLLSTWTKPNALLALGEVFWAGEPSDDLRAIYGGQGDWADLEGTLDRIGSHGYDLVEMILASSDDWDRYEAGKWANLAAWLDTHPDDPRAGQIRQEWKSRQRLYLHAERRCIGWGIFIVRSATESQRADYHRYRKPAPKRQLPSGTRSALPNTHSGDGGQK